MAIRTLELYRPHPGQMQGHESQKRFNILCWGRQSGKTTYGLNKIAGRAWEGRRDGIYWYILQTYDAAQVAFKRMYKFYRASPRAFDKKPNESDLLCRFRHGPEISFKSGKNFEDLRVETLDGVVIDEYRQQHPDLWPAVIRPMLGHRNGWADILSTPNGFDHFKDMFDAAKLDSEWGWFHAPSTVAPWWTEKEIESAKRSMSEAVFSQEILAEFRNIHAGKAYLAEGVHNHARTSPFCTDGGLVSPYLPIVVGLDFNVNPMAWTLGQNRGRQFYWFQEIVVSNTNTTECAPELVGRLKALKSENLLRAQPNVILIGDATGKSRNTKATESDYAIITNALNEAGISWDNRTPESNPPVKERVNTVNSLLRSADGTVSFFYHPENCNKLRRDLERVSWKQGAEFMLDQKTDTSLTHSSDSVGYPACVLSPIEAFGSVGVTRIIRR